MKIALAFMLLAGLIPTSPAATIDDFSTPQGPLTGGGSDTVSGPGIIGDSRFALAGDFFEAAGGVGTFSFSTSGNVSSLAYSGPTGLGFAPVDLTDGGLASLFLLGISGLDGGASFAIGVSDADSIASVPITLLALAPGVHSAPIPTALADFTRVDEVSMTVFLSPIGSTGASVSIDYFCTGTLEAGCTSTELVNQVTEPATGAMLILVAALLPMLARKRASAH